MIRRVSKEKYNIFCTFVCLVCFITNISQMPYFVESSLTRYISIPIWLLLGCVCIFKKHVLNIGGIKHVLLITILFFAYYFIARTFNRDFGGSSLPYPMALSIFVLIIGTMVGSFLNIDDLKRIATFYIWSGFAVCINVYFTYIYGKSIVGPTYLYGSKNSVSQILLTTWILILLLKFNDRGFIRKAMYVSVLALLTFSMLALKSRATIIGMPAIMIWVVINGKLNKKVRNIIIIFLLGFIILMFNNNVYDVILNDILFGGRDASNISALSSGRSNEWLAFGKDFADSWLFGVGRAKRESVILTSLLEFGIFGGGLILMLAVSPFAWGMKRLSKQHPLFLVFTSLAMVYFINGIFEQLAPFGPGVKCYFLWFLFGILTSNKYSCLKRERILDE